MEQIRILGFAGSLRRASYNRGLVRAASELAPSGIVVEAFDLSDIPLYNQDVEDAGEPASVVAFKQAIAGADALLVATPEYNHGVPGSAQERPRLGLTATGDEPAPRQAGRRHGRQPRHWIDRTRPGPAARDIRVYGGVRHAAARAPDRRRGRALRPRWQPDGPRRARLADGARQGVAGLDASHRPPSGRSVRSNERSHPPWRRRMAHHQRGAGRRGRR